MPDFDKPWPYVVALLVVILAYFLKDAHSEIKGSLRNKADKDDMRRMEESNQREIERIERLYETKFATVVIQLQERINAVEKNLSDLILKLLSKQ
ncbi:MAG TPA: hypothetical protein VN663_14325 [Ramlibacter sp.]|nr:hypothetical protein [Ramlibacter sp.]